MANAASTSTLRVYYAPMDLGNPPSFTSSSTTPTTPSSSISTTTTTMTTTTATMPMTSSSTTQSTAEVAKSHMSHDEEEVKERGVGSLSGAARRFSLPSTEWERVNMLIDIDNNGKRDTVCFSYKKTKYRAWRGIVGSISCIFIQERDARNRRSSDQLMAIGCSEKGELAILDKNRFTLKAPGEVLEEFKNALQGKAAKREMHKKPSLFTVADWTKTEMWRKR